MLQSLTIKNIVVIASAHIDFSKGLTALTGETGAGKSILIDALTLLLGERASHSLIRKGANTASVSGTFSNIDAPLKNKLQSHGINIDDTMIIRRTLSTDGKNQAFLNDTPVSLGFLKEVGSQLINVHNQFDAMLQPQKHLACLDLYGNIDTTEVKTAFSMWDESRKKLKAAEATYAEKETLLNQIQFKRSLLKKLSPKPGEEAQLLSQKEQAKHAKKLSDLRNNIQTLFYEPIHLKKRLQTIETSASSMNIEDCGKIGAMASELKSMCLDLEAYGDNLSHMAGGISLNQIEERLYALREGAFALGVDTADLHTLDGDLETQEKTLADEGNLQALHEGEEKARKVFLKHAEQVKEARHKAGISLTKDMTTCLGQLKLPHAQFTVNQSLLNSNQWTKETAYSVTFDVSLNKGIPAGPLMKVASGGERSRLMLALKSLLHVKIPVLIFDEIDSGLGGDVASHMGTMLCVLAQKNQILCITHAPQIAALADQHLCVQKNTEDQHTTTDVHVLDSADQLEELARMLSGKTITEASRVAAQSLLSEKV